MRIQSISNTSTFAANKLTIVNSGNNKNIKFLYNKVCDLTTQNQVTTIFANDKIEISSPSSNQTRKITKGLMNMGAEFLVDNKFFYVSKNVGDTKYYHFLSKNN